MKVTVQSVKFDADGKLLDFVEAKMSKLDRFVEKATSAEVIMKLDRDHDKGNKVVTVVVNVPGEELVAENRSKSFEEALDLDIEALKKQFEKSKHRFDK